MIFGLGLAMTSLTLVLFGVGGLLVLALHRVATALEALAPDDVQNAVRVAKKATGED